MRGHIRPAGKNKWRLQVTVGRDPVTGKRQQRYRTIEGTKKKAEAELATWVAEIAAGTNLDPSKLAVGDFLARWLENRKPKVAPRTHERYESLVRVQIVPVFGAIPLTKLRPLHLEDAYARLRTSGLSEQTVLHVHRLLFSALRWGVQMQLLGRNVAESVEVPKPTRRDVEAMTVADATAVVEAVAGTWMELPVVLALGTGLRRAEVLGLTWANVNLEETLIFDERTKQTIVIPPSLRVMQTVQMVGNQPRFVPPKTHRSKRPLALPGSLVEALRAHKKAQNERRLMLGEAWQDFDLVIERGDGSPVRPYTLSDTFSSRMKQVGRSLTFHGLRHGHASLMLSAGVQMKVVSSRLGHSSYSITADLYTHVAPALDAQAATSFDALVSRTEGRT